MRVSSVAQLITVLILFFLVLAATYYVTKWIAKYQKQSTFTSNMEVMETCRISTTKYLQIVRVVNKYLVISVSKDSVTLLTELSEDEYEPPAVRGSEPVDFAKEFDKVLERFKKK
ncbi:MULTISPECIES: flagellar biosynthetic protein FliO [unclassified Butyrivibrio]|uniref:flagellar biosynthetic protein FliO n=1 Tax=unclassified Butyrivibrio TaxID=2639466 RepID=UPI0003B763A1|nr:MULTISPECIES: flagellar biosynthetic protein FliO [unclassified Butyrivibrio]SDB39381.1 flagellar protein FliO/FliZ [Butyrivibrio sp. INlla16]SEK44266.1 flagellar protein FliO/FliZ [Butyrivibrio sp. ob235]